MLKSSFCHIPGISNDTEKILWKNGIFNWDSFLENIENISFLSQNKLNHIKQEIFFSKEELENNNLQYFKTKFHPTEHYRLHNFGKIGFLDIETTGLSRWTDKITMIGIYDGIEAKTYVCGQDLEEGVEKLKEFDVIVTFNGKLFDVPFIEQKYGIKYNFVHLDLRFLLKEFGLQGGLKNIEKELGIIRDISVANVDGFEAVRLWKKYEYGDINALKTLLTYNKEDIVNLKFLLDWYLEKKKNYLGVDFL